MKLTVVPAAPDAEHWLSSNLRNPLASSNVRSVVSWIKSPLAGGAITADISEVRKTGQHHMLFNNTVRGGEICHIVVEVADEFAAQFMDLITSDGRHTIVKN